MFGTFETPEELHNFIKENFYSDMGRVAAYQLAAMIYETCNKKHVTIECPHCTTQILHKD